MMTMMVAHVARNGEIWREERHDQSGVRQIDTVVLSHEEGLQWDNVSSEALCLDRRGRR